MRSDCTKPGTTAYDASGSDARPGGPMFETTLTIPTRQLREFTARMSKAGYSVLDTGARVTTDEDVDGEATIRLVSIPTVEIVDPAHYDHGISA